MFSCEDFSACPSRLGDRTSHTLLRQDMTYTFELKVCYLASNWAVFHVYDVENHFDYWRAAAFCKRGAQGPETCCSIVSVVWGQPSRGLQVAQAICRRGAAWIERSVATAARIAEALGTRMGETIAPGPAAAPEVGRKKDCGLLAARLSPGSEGHSSHDRSLVEPIGVGAAFAPPILARSKHRARCVDSAQTQQPSVDGGFQRVVPHTGWSPDRAVDGARFVEPICSGGSPFARSELVAGPKGFREIVSSVWVAQNHSDGQRRTLCFQGASRAVAAECLVDELGNPGRVHAAWASRRQWSTRAVPRGAQSRDDTTAIEHGPGAAATNRSMGAAIQFCPAAPGVEQPDTGKVVSAQSTRVWEQAFDYDLFGHVGSAPGSQQRADQVARAKTVHRRSFRAIRRRTEATGTHRMGSLFRNGPVGNPSRVGLWRTPAYGLRPPESDQWPKQSVSDVLSSKCKLCRVAEPTPSLSPSDGERVAVGRVRGQPWTFDARPSTSVAAAPRWVHLRF